MAESSGFFGSTAGDRKYTSGQMSEFMAMVTSNTSGVVRSFENELELTQNGAGSALVDTGRALHLGRWYKNTASVSKTLSAVTINNKRRDRVVIRFDSVTARSGVVTVINGVETTGTPASPAIGADDVLLGYVESYNNAGVYSYSSVDERVYAFDSSVITSAIAPSAVTNEKIANMAQSTIKGRASGTGTGDPIDLSTTQVAGIMDNESNWVSNSELADMAQTTVKGRASGAGTGDPTDLSASQLLDIVKTVDGSGSGLDADLLDGNSSSYYTAEVSTGGNISSNYNIALEIGQVCNVCIHNTSGAEVYLTGTSGQYRYSYFYYRIGGGVSVGVQGATTGAGVTNIISLLGSSYDIYYVISLKRIA